MQTNLFIIGNGFDLGHGIPTSYDANFKPWILNNYPEAGMAEDVWFLEPTTFPDGEERLSDTDAAAFIINRINDSCRGDWNNFETALGVIDWAYFFDALPEVLDKEGDPDIFHMEQDREALARTLGLNLKCFSYLFSKWINSIKYPKRDINPFLTEKMKTESLFLNFNYTKTLEEFYGISPANICHIHGMQGSDIIVGHGLTSEYHDGIFLDRETDLCWALYKPTKEIFNNHKKFFDRVRENHIQNIYSWGFSFSDPDLYYIQEISSMLNKEHAIWHLHEYSVTDCETYKEKLRECGFSGIIDTFKA